MKRGVVYLRVFCAYFSLLLLGLFLSCALYPNYDEINDNTIKLELELNNADDAEIAQVHISSDDFDTITILKELNTNRIVCRIPKCKEDDSKSALDVKAYVDTKLKYLKNVTIETPDKDTTLVISLNIYDGPVPKAPENISLTLVDSNAAVAISWDLSEHAKKYKVFKKIGSSGNSAMIGDQSGTKFKDSNILPEKTYLYAVSAYNGTGESKPSSYEAITTPGYTEPPDKPENLTISNIAEKSVSLQWDKSTKASKYYLYRKTGDGIPVDKIDSTDQLTFVDNDLTPNTTYSYAVSAYNSKGESLKSEKVTGKTKVPAPGIPKNLKAEALSDKSISIIWDSVVYAEAFEIYKSLDQTNNFSLDSASLTHSFISTGLKEKTTYYYKIKSKNREGTSGFSKVVSATTKEKPVEKPKTPNNVAARALSPYAALVDWSKTANTSNYNVYRSRSSSGTFTKIQSLVDTMYKDSGLQEDTEYYYKVTAENAAGESPRSSAASVRTWIVIKVPTGLSGKALSSSALSLDWNSVSGAQLYKIFKSSDQGGPFTLLDSVSNTSFSDTGLEANTSYFYKVSAKGQSGESEQTGAVKVTTKMPIPAVPTGLKATALSASEIQIEFDPVNGATGYILYDNSRQSGTYDLVDTLGSTNFTHSNLQPNTTYYYKVSSFSDGGESDLSDFDSATTDKKPPDTPSNLRANAKISTEIELSYSSVSDADEYVIYHSLTSSGTFTELQRTTRTYYTHKGLEPKSKHYYKVSASNSNGESPQSNYVTETTPGKKVAYIRQCRACDRCPGRCDERAIKWNSSTRKYYVDTDLCTGCGDCLSACRWDYIELREIIEKVKTYLKRYMPHMGNAKH